ncbi:helix-turn-helix domain-containing protein [Paenibacillus macerans]|uniref:Helix-turn-helix domain-containing protein n=1 Tax=Paenibacillus macerans TaxID=44252 RepID=A0A6N8F6P0_PAEMA|nr:helix-turn-helix transcriptional regulator [Paenibacillus macerans]MUG26488.1 helix-turn-helix domain-containing protein [Paenibacillus macerans]OMG47295.1 hypothetical protein BK140_22575 [Paenibacillus macerans]
MTNESDVKNARRQKSIREARINKRISLRKAAFKLGISPNRLEYFENDPRKIPFQMARSLTQLYGISIDDITFLRT